MPSTAQPTPQPSAQPPADAVDIFVNDARRSISAGTSLLALLDDMALAGRPGLAVAVNASVVSRADWAGRELGEGDQVLVINASQGG
jgi:thiamine biosynthesis protein ThiS